MVVAVDTNIFLYVLTGQAPFADPAVLLLKKVQRGEYKALFSTLVYSEMLGNKRNPAAMHRAHSFLDELKNTRSVPLDTDIAKDAATLRVKHPSLRLADSVHLATAVKLASLFVTQDKKLAKIASEQIKTKSLFEL